MSERCAECGRTLPCDWLREIGSDSDGDAEVALYICGDCVDDAEERKGK